MLTDLYSFLASLWSFRRKYSIDRLFEITSATVSRTPTRAYLWYSIVISRVLWWIQVQSLSQEKVDLWDIFFWKVMTVEKYAYGYSRTVSIILLFVSQRNLWFASYYIASFMNHAQHSWVIIDQRRHPFSLFSERRVTHTF